MFGGTIKASEIGGGYVRRIFTFGDRRMKRGDHLTAAELRSMRASNRQSLVDSHYVDIYPPARAGEAEPTERHIVSRGFGKFDVIEGRKLNDAPLTKDLAEALAGTTEAPATN